MLEWHLFDGCWTDDLRLFFDCGFGVGMGVCLCVMSEAVTTATNLSRIVIQNQPREFSENVGPR